MFEKGLAPLGSGLVTASEPVIEKESNKHLDRYVFCMEDVDLNDRILSIKFIHRGRFNRLSDVSYGALDMSEEALLREVVPDETHSTINKVFIKTASDSALEVYAAYGPRGLITVNTLTGKDPVTVKAIEQELLGNYTDNLEEFGTFLENLKFADNKAAAVTKQVRDELLQCVKFTLNYREDVVNKAEAEMSHRALPGGHGLDHIPKGARFYSESLGRTLRSEKLDNVEKTPIQVTVDNKGSNLDPEVIASIAAQAAIAAVEAMTSKMAKK